MGFDDRDLRANKSPRAGETAEGTTTTGGNPVDAVPNVTDRADALEQVDNGRRLALAMEQELLAQVAQGEGFIPEALNPESAERIGTKLLDAQGHILAAAYEVPLEGEVHLHKQFCALLKQIDDIGAVLSERFSS
jgi:hypothetical protein